MATVGRRVGRLDVRLVPPSGDVTVTFYWPVRRAAHTASVNAEGGMSAIAYPSAVISPHAREYHNSLPSGLRSSTTPLHAPKSTAFTVPSGYL